MCLANLGFGPVRQLSRAVGLEQGWRLFAPKPVSDETVLEGEIAYVDGTSELWRLDGPDHRHRLWQRRVASDSGAALWEPAARWLVRSRSRGRRVASVTLRRRWRPVAGAERNWTEFDFFRLDLSAGQ